MNTGRQIARFGILSLALVPSACGGGNEGGGSPTSPTDATGTIQLTVLTVNTPAGTGSYSANISGVGDRAIGPNARLTIEDVPTGSRTVAISGLPGACVLRTDSRNVTVLKGARAVVDFVAVCPTGIPAADRIVFERNDDIHVMNIDGTGLANLTDHAANDEWPDVSPDGTRILFTSEGRDPANPALGREVWAMNADGSGQQRLAPGMNPSWSPDGTRVVFERSVAGTGRDIFIMNADGTGIESVSQGSGDEELVRWSPDGNRLVFADDGDGSNQDFDIFLVNADGTGRQPLVATVSQWDMFPDWSPDGTKIVFQIFHANDVSIYLKDLDVPGFVRLTQGAGDWNPRWSPDGTRILFTSDRSGTWDIHVMEADGTGITRLTTDPATDDGPGWWR